MDRRRFIDWLLGITGTATLGSILYPVVRYLVPPGEPEASATSVTAATVGEVPVNGFKIFKFGTKPGILIRRGEKEFLAFSAKCTHLDCIVQYRGDSRMLWCACHNGFYDLTGKNVSGPPPRPLEEFQARVLGDKVIVSKV